MLKLVNVASGYKAHIVLRDFTLLLPRGKLVSIIGPNGAGKTTLLRTIAGVLKPIKGHVYVNEEDLYEIPVRERARLIAYLPAEAQQAPGLRVKDYLLSARIPWLKGLWESREDIELLKRLSEKLGLHNLLTRELGSLSSGERRRVEIAWCLMRDAHILVLDEPTVHLDPSYQAWVMKILIEFARSNLVIMAVHDLNLALTYSDIVIGIKEGRIMFAKPPSSIRKDELEKLYDVRFIDLRDPSKNLVYYIPLVIT